VKTVRLAERHDEDGLELADLIRLEHFYKGGPEFHAAIDRYLPTRPAEKDFPTVYAYRKARAVYPNYVGTIIDWIVVRLFKKPAVIRKVAKDGDEADDREALPDDWRAFLDDVDGRGTSWTFFWMKAAIRSILDKRHYIGWTFPKSGEQATDLAKAKASGALNPQLRRFQRRDLNDIERDDAGNIAWAVFEFDVADRASPENERPKCAKEWLLVTPKYAARYRRPMNAQNDKNGNIPEDEDAVEIERIPLTSLPLIELKIPHGLCLGFKLDSVARAIFQAMSDHQWAIQMNAFPQPERFGKMKTKTPTGEAYCHVYEDGEKGKSGLNYAEPAGTSFAAQRENITMLKDEMYRIVHQLALAAKLNTGRAGQSAESKEMDYASTDDVLHAYGQVIRECMRKTLNAIARARGEDTEFEVSGLDEHIEVSDLLTYLQTLDAAGPILNRSPTLKRVAQDPAVEALSATASDRTKQAIRDELAENEEEPESREEEAENLRQGLTGQDNTDMASRESSSPAREMSRKMGVEKSRA
jgi:hypothetical protein